MNRVAILERLNGVFADVFDEEELCISEETTPNDIEDWDSIGHVYLTVEIEDEFGVKLGEKMAQIKSVKGIVDLLEEVLKDDGA